MMVKQASLPNRLPVLRAERAISQLALAKKARISHNRYWRIENGHATASDVERNMLARVLGVAVNDIWSVTA